MKLATLALVALLAACGGGGGPSPSASGSIAPAPALRTDLLFGYYGGTSVHVLEMAPHANLFWSADFDDDYVEAVRQAAGAYQAIVLHVPGAKGEAAVRERLDALQRAGLLTAKVVALYRRDEPDRYESDAEASAGNAMLRRVLADYPAIAGAKLAVIYTCGGGRPGMASYDWIGCDDYGRGCGALQAIDGIKAQLRPGQRLIVVPGGADPWRQDPACFESYAHGEPLVVAVVPFIWQTVTDGQTFVGIRVNPTRPLYEAAGRKIKG